MIELNVNECFASPGRSFAVFAFKGSITCDTIGIFAGQASSHL